MNIIDLHCDVLYKMEKYDYNFKNDSNLDVNYEKLIKGGVKVQAMALFMDPTFPIEEMYTSALRQIKKYREEVITQPNIVDLKSLKDISLLEENQIGTFLTLEGLDCIGNDITKLERLLDEGVLLVGITWNGINFACDGQGEPRGAGLSSFGYEVIELLNGRDIFVDVSHISEQGFWDVIDRAKHIIASHSNTYALLNHGRNLKDEQIRAILDKNGRIHMVLYPSFIHKSGEASMDDLKKHLDHLLSLEALSNIGLGSDFDGISTKIKGLEDSSHYQNLIEYLQENYDVDTTRKIASQNFIDYVDTYL